MKRKPTKLNIKILFLFNLYKFYIFLNASAEKRDKFVNFQGLKANLHKTLVLCNTMFFILTCFDLTNFSSRRKIQLAAF